MRKRWTEAEDQMLRDLYPITCVENVAIALSGRTENAIRSRAYALRISAFPRKNAKSR